MLNKIKNTLLKKEIYKHKYFLLRFYSSINNILKYTLKMPNTYRIDKTDYKS